jgi:5-methylcytosine-specific restriction endonuclease McrA
MTNLKRNRQSAFTQQNGKCCYCGFSMWLDSVESFAKQHCISVKQARYFQCTAEHLVARQDGGGNSRTNIAAACTRCNSLRHRRKAPMEPEKYHCYVQERLKKGGWHHMPKSAMH